MIDLLKAMEKKMFDADFHEKIAQKYHAKFLLESGNRVMIKRKLFEEFLDRASVI